ncbi:unnamed protein product [Brassica napus]|uniref:(rape) hypothetical protein n=1 Tax=Brassica napus TaxID=3708 RepID=A0A817AR30_BRANA|nr:unnamed protein product [Brassica napus]
MTELEKKLNKLEIYCHNLKSGVDECSSNNKKQSIPVRFNDGIIQQFLVSVSESRSSIRALSRALASQTRSCVPLVGKSTSGSLSQLFREEPEKPDLLPRSDPEQSLLRELRTSKLPGFRKRVDPDFEPE